MGWFIAVLVIADFVGLRFVDPRHCPRRHARSKSHANQEANWLAMMAAGLAGAPPGYPQSSIGSGTATTGACWSTCLARDRTGGTVRAEAALVTALSGPSHFHGDP
jgi:hypothetical protein